MTHIYIRVLILILAQTNQMEELYKYKVGQMITQSNEDFIIDQFYFQSRNEDQQKLEIYDMLGLIRVTHHSIDIIDMKNEQGQIWVLYRKDNQTRFSKHQIDYQNQENYYLQLHYECYQFYFISKSQIVIDCQNQISNVLILFDIECNLQQSFFHSKYKKSSLRKFLKTEPSNSFLFIQQEQFLKICYNNKFQVCQQLIYIHEAHSVYTQQNQLLLISEKLIDVFFIEQNNQFIYIERKDLSKIPLEIEYRILFYYFDFISNYHYIVEINKINICNEGCQTIILSYAPIKISEQQNYLIIQTQSNIVILCMLDKKLIILDIVFNHEVVVVNRKLEEFYIGNDVQLMYYGLTKVPYFRVRHQSIIIDTAIHFNQFQKEQPQLKNAKILFNDNFKFNSYSSLENEENQFLLTGGLLDISFSVEDKYKKSIKLTHSHFLKTQYQNVIYFWFNTQNKFVRKDHIVIFNKNQTIFYSKFGNFPRYQSYVDDLNFFQEILSFNQGYLMQDIRDGLKYIMIINDTLQIDLIQFECIHDLDIIQCFQKYCICLNDTLVIEQKEYGLSQFYKQEEDRFLHLDQENRILYLLNDNKLIIKYYDVNLNNIHNYEILICSTFIDLVVFNLKMIIICTDQMIIYNKISNYRYIYSGNIELYDQKFIKSPQAINSQDYLFYIIQNEILHVFNSNLPLSQIYVTQMKLDKFDIVKSQNNDICFQFKDNLQCFQYQLNIKFKYDKVEYHQVFRVNICAQNIYDKICKEYTTRIDQQFREILLKSTKYQLNFQKNTKEILLDNRFFSGSVDKIQINKYSIKPKLQFQSHGQINHGLSRIYYGGKDKFIFILKNQQLQVYDIETRLFKNLITLKPLRYVLQYKTNQILIGFYYISVINCDYECKELITLDYKLSQQGFLFIHNNSLYTTIQTSLLIYDLDNLINNETFQPIKEELFINIIEIAQDNNGYMCMAYINGENKLVFKHLEQMKIFNLLNSFRQQGVYLENLHQDIIYSIKLLDNCKLLYINANFGTYFIEIGKELKFLAQIVVQKSHNIHMNQLLFGNNNLFYVQQFPTHISIFKFTYHQIYNSKYIDFFSIIKKQNREFFNKDYYLQIYNDELYLTQTDFEKLFIFKVNPEIIIQLDQDVTDKEQIQITLHNSDENKSFQLELVVEDNNFFLCVYWIFIVLLFLCYIWLIYKKIQKNDYMINKG